MHTSQNAPESVVQRQLEAYNSKDLETLLDVYAEDARQFEHPSTLIATGRDQLRGRFAERFREPNLHAKLNKRIVMDNIVIDHETITRTFPEGPGTSELTAIYEVLDGRISRAWFIRGRTELAGKQ